jgi:hypothetical protein
MRHQIRVWNEAVTMLLLCGVSVFILEKEQEMRKRTRIVLGIGLLISALSVGPALAIQAVIQPSLAYNLNYWNNHGTGMYYTNFYYAAHPVTLMKYDLSSIDVPAGYMAMVTSASISFYSGGENGDFLDGIWSRDDNFDAGTTWDGRGTQGDLLATWAYTVWNPAVVATSGSMASYVQSQANGDKTVSFWMQDYNGSGLNDGTVHNYYGVPDSGALTLEYTLEPVPEPMTLSFGVFGLAFLLHRRRGCFQK